MILAFGSAKISFWHSLSGRTGFAIPSATFFYDFRPDGICNPVRNFSDGSDLIVTIRTAGDSRLRLCQNFILALPFQAGLRPDGISLKPDGICNPVRNFSDGSDLIVTIRTAGDSRLRLCQNFILALPFQAGLRPDGI